MRCRQAGLANAFAILLGQRPEHITPGFMYLER